jgi:hypothetical protein
LEESMDNKLKISDIKLKKKVKEIEEKIKKLPGP